MTNRFIIIKEDGTEVLNPPTIEGLNIRFNGDNNTIIVHEPFHFNGTVISLAGDVTIEIHPRSQWGNGTVIRKTRNTVANKLDIGQGFQCGSNCIIDLTDAGDIYIGDDAKWSWNIYVKSDDTHPVFDIDTKECLNKSTKIVIGKHVWIGMNAVILKNSIIPNNSVVGAYSVVAKKFNQENVVIAGNPAQVRKTNINWTHGSINDYCQKHQKEM